MSRLSLEWDGLTEFEAALRALPATVYAEAETITRQAADEAAATMAALYPTRTGLLARSLQVVQRQTGPYGTRAIVINTAPHAYLFDIGTQARHTSLGAFRGSMPVGKVFIPTVIRGRRAMFAALKAMLVRAGLLVSGEP